MTEQIAHLVETTEGQTQVWWKRVQQLSNEGADLNAAMIAARKRYPRAYQNMIDEANKTQEQK